MSGSMFGNLKIGTRLLLFAAVQLLVLALVVALIAFRVKDLEGDIAGLTGEVYPMVIKAEEALQEYGVVNDAIMDAALTHRREVLAAADQAAARFRAMLGELRERESRRGARESLQALDAVLADFDAQCRDGKDMAAAYIAKGQEAGNAVMEAYDARAGALRKRLADWCDAQEALAREEGRVMLEESRRLLFAVLAILAVAVVAGLAVSRAFARAIAGPIEAVAGAARQVASGNLKVQLPAAGRGDEIGDLLQSLEHMLGMLRGQAKEISESAANLAAAIVELSSTSSTLAASSTETASTIHEVGATVSEVRHIANVANEKTGAMVGEAKHMRAVAADGRKATDDVLAAVRDIRQEMEHIAKTTVELGEHTQDISEIIGSVNDITDQTNLLSVNASIEAAKAGEAGKGFAVVAQEMKLLTGKSKEATKQIAAILGDIQKAAGRAVMAAERGGKAVERGVALTGKSGEAIALLDGNVGASVASAEQIGASSLQQLTGMDQLVEAMENIKTATRQNVDGAKQLEEATRNLGELAQRMRGLTQRFTA